MSSKINFFNEALNESSKSECDMKHGAVIVKGGQIISKGYNQNRVMSKIMRKFGFKDCASIHAECDAIINAIKLSMSCVSSLKQYKKGCFLSPKWL